MTTLTLEASPETEVLLYGPASKGPADLLFEGVREEFYYQWRMHKPREAFIKGEYSFNLPQEVK